MFGLISISFVRVVSHFYAESRAPINFKICSWARRIAAEEMAESYGQFCPVAQAAEVLTERWTLLVLRELLMGSTRFNEIQKGVPRMSSSLLSKRLRELERSDLLTREPLKGERGHSYRLTPAGEALGPLVVSLGTWSRDWLKREITPRKRTPPC